MVLILRSHSNLHHNLFAILKNMGSCLQTMVILVFIGSYKIHCTINVRGKGASFPLKVYQLWIPSYKAYRSNHVTLNMEYYAIGSSDGKSAIMDGTDIEYAGSDSLLSSSESSIYSDLIAFPTMAG